MIQDLADALLIILQQKPISLVLIGSLYIVALTFMAKTPIGKRFLRIINSLFYTESDTNSSSNIKRRLAELEENVALLQKSLTDKNLESRRDAILAEVENQLTRELPTLVQSKIEDIKAIDHSIDSSIREAVDSTVTSYLSKHTPSDIVKSRIEHARLTERTDRANLLENTIEEQMRSAGRLKAVMINLFVVFNIGILLIYLFTAQSLTDKAITAIIGLYVSLAAFIVYIYRTSNFRSSVLLALREDAKKYFDADDYIRRLKPGASPTERDIEVLKLLMLNRAEREKMASHPYELVLKGVTNSNIQFKGGKITPIDKK